MTLIIADRVKIRSTTTGTGDYAFGPAVAGFQTFEDVGVDGDTCYYVAEMGDEWEIGIGTLQIPQDDIVRTLILGSSNSGNEVNWGAGYKLITLCTPAKEMNIVGDNELNIAGNLLFATEDFDLNLGRNITCTNATEDVTITFSNVRSPVDLVFLEVTNPGAFGFVITGALYPNGVPPAWTVAGVDLIGLKTLDGGTTWHAAVRQASS